ncbi:hypothetical protein D9M73_192110 [compost metagenome]
MTSIAASVGPYRLCRRAPGRWLNTCCWVSTASASPLQITCRTLWQRCRPGSRTNTCSIDGTKCKVVTWWRSMVSISRSGSRCSPGAARASRAPVISGQKNSHTDTSKLNGVFCNTVSAPSSAYACCIHASRLYNARWRLPAPFGRPVEPEV